MSPSTKQNGPIRIGLIGAGYIAQWHADAIRQTDGAELSAVCDVSLSQAEDLARFTGAQAFGSVDDMLTAGCCDAVHILTPPNSHAALAIQCLEAGLHVLVEKPVALSAGEVRQIENVATRTNRRFHAGHNFLALPSYTKLKQEIDRGRLGRVSNAELHWCFPLTPLRSGPFSIWPLRSTQNLLLELGPHLMAFAVDLFGLPDIEHVSLGKPIALPGGETRPQSWRILARAGDVDVTLVLSLVETADDRSVTVRGSSARARLDFAADTLEVDAENTSDLVLNPLRRQFSLAWQHLRDGSVNAVRQFTSFNRKSPYGLSFLEMLNAIYAPMQSGAPIDPRFSGVSAINVMTGLDRVLERVKAEVPAPVFATRAPKPTSMVIGGTGFIGRALTRALVASGEDVRVVSRGRNGPFPDLPDQVETVALSLRDTDGLSQAMTGISTVYNLARSVETTWEGCLVNDVAVAEGIAQAALKAGVGRLVYTGTIASYDMSDPKKVITEATPFAEDMTDRNLYARSKAECERRLLALHRDQGLPLVIARPGIVVGAGGPLQHWGIGRWHGAGAVRIWGSGRNTLPFVLIDDTVDGLIRMAETDGIEGQSFNLVGPQMMGAQDYFDAIEEALGARIKVSRGNLHMMYAADAVKYVLKTKVLRRSGITRPSLADWKSRAHLSPFDSSQTQLRLDWHPEKDREAFILKAITEANLFGF